MEIGKQLTGWFSQAVDAYGAGKVEEIKAGFGGALGKQAAAATANPDADRSSSVATFDAKTAIGTQQKTLVDDGKNPATAGAGMSTGTVLLVLAAAVGLAWLAMRK